VERQERARLSSRSETASIRHAVAQAAARLRHARGRGAIRHSARIDGDRVRFDPSRRSERRIASRRAGRAREHVSGPYAHPAVRSLTRLAHAGDDVEHAAI
jgi:hypothetical protein